MPEEGSKGSLAQPEAMLLVRQMVLVRLDWLSITPLGRPACNHKVNSEIFCRGDLGFRFPSTCCSARERENTESLINIK